MNYSTSQKALLFLFPCIIMGLMAGSIVGLAVSGLSMFSYIYLLTVITTTAYGACMWLYIPVNRNSEGETKVDWVFITVFIIALFYLIFSTIFIIILMH